jgi:hypothetical protein
VGARLQIYIECIAARQRPGLLYRKHLGMLQFRVDMSPAADNLSTLVDNDGPDQRIWRNQSLTTRRKVQCLLKKQLIGGNGHSLGE